MESSVEIVKIRLTPMPFDFLFNGQPETQMGGRCDAERAPPPGANELFAAD